MKEFRILSLDGGGSWALIQVRTLIEIYTRLWGKPADEITGHEVLKRFDFIAANSGGALTLAGLIKNWSLAELLHLFEDEAQRRKIFAAANIFDRPLEHIPRLIGIGPKYSTLKKLEGLREILGNVGARQVADLPDYVGSNYIGRKPQFLFCSMNYDTERAAFFRSQTHSLAASAAPPMPTSLLDAVHASANPPVNLFDLPATRSDGTRFWDGAIAGNNNPVMAAVIETLANKTEFETDRDKIKALSLGTGNTMLPVKFGDLSPAEVPYYAKVERPWILADVKKLALAIMGDPPDAATFHAHMLLDGSLPLHTATHPLASPIIRMNPLIQPVPDGNDGWTAPQGFDAPRFLRLRSLDMDGITRDDIVVINHFCDHWFSDDVPNQPVRANARTFRAEIGHAKYSQAFAAALANFA